jgi:methylmalonyl-CoA/ethylmalonyl-CoA epimerase
VIEDASRQDPVLRKAFDAAGVTARFDHAAHAAPHIRDLLPTYRDLLGGEYAAGGPNTRVGYRAAYLKFSGGGHMELMEPLEGSTFFDSFFARQPLGGLHHVTYHVDSIESAIAIADQLDIEVVGTWFDRADYKEAFLHPRSNHGVLLQLVEVTPEYQPMGIDSTFDEFLETAL